MIKTEFLMWNANQHKFQCSSLYCGMNVQISKFQDKILYWHKNNNTSSILTKQSCLLKIPWLKKGIPTKSYSLAMLPLHHTKYSYHAQPRFQPSTCFHTLFFQTFQLSRNTWAWAMDIALWWNRVVVVEKTKRRKIVSHQLGVSMGYGDTHQ